MNKPNRPFRLLADRTKMSHQDWMSLRLKFLNASEVAAAIGLNPYQTPNELWAIKTGIVKQEYKDNDAMFWGRTMEPVLRNHYANSENCKVVEVPYIMQSIEYPWLCGNVDGVAIYENRDADSDKPEKAIIEIKTGSSFTEEQWEGENAAPLHYMVQLLIYQKITGVHFGYLVSLIGGNKYHVVRVDYDEDTVNAILGQAEIFWNHVKTRTPLPPSYGDNEVISKLYPQSKPTSIALPAEFMSKLDNLCDIKIQIAELKKKQELIENEIKLAMAENEAAKVDGYSISYKSSNRITFNTELAKSFLNAEQINSCTATSSYRTLRISKAKPKK